MSEVAALQAALAGEHACVFGYGVVGGVLAGDEEEPAGAAFDTHRRRRDDLARLLRDSGTEPVAALPGYTLPLPVRTAAEARELAGLLEARQAVLLAELVAAAGTSTLRATAARWLADAAVRGASWSGAVTALPGLDPAP
jgi:hypothetical protein